MKKTGDKFIGIWSQNIDQESVFWRRWFTEDAFKLAREQRLQLSRTPLSKVFCDECGALPGELVRILDVGSGPISTMRTKSIDNPVELVCVDALAEIYNELLDEFGYEDCPRILQLKGEELSSKLAKNSFHHVNIANALDHCEDPEKTLNEMYSVCRPGGRVVVISIENEGEREGYRGLHQWNLLANDEGLWLWNPTFRKNLIAKLPAPAFKWQYLNNGQVGFKSFSFELRKPKLS
jgi:ubiquinone/menaquinone biosynthesis C-methylase UbiE